MNINVIIAACALFAVISASHLHHDHHEHHAPQPYKFGYEVKDKEGSQYRHEEGDGSGHVRGSYGYVDHKGLHRQVNYVADKAGFRAEVKTNEPGTANQDPANVKVHSSAHHEHHQGHHQGPHHGHHQG